MRKLKFTDVSAPGNRQKENIAYAIGGVGYLLELAAPGSNKGQSNFKRHINILELLKESCAEKLVATTMSLTRV